jgi:hypothetical protein
LIVQLAAVGREKSNQVGVGQFLRSIPAGKPRFGICCRRNELDCRFLTLTFGEEDGARVRTAQVLDEVEFVIDDLTG